MDTPKASAKAVTVNRPGLDVRWAHREFADCNEYAIVRFRSLPGR
jgi:hypothetical protein